METEKDMNIARDGSGDNSVQLLEIQNLKVQFFTDAGIVRAVDGVDFSVKKQEVFGIVGESGCGKSMTARSILQLVPKPGKIISGKILFDGINLLDLTKPDMQNLRGDAISMVFQEPMSSLNPVYRVGNQIEEILVAHRREMSKKDRMDRVEELLGLVGIPSPKQRARNYPYELSGGMRQRVMIAMALACGNPKLLIADEPTTALDVTIQAQILELFQELVQKIGMSVILITHDLGVIAETANRVAVMYAGSIVESASVTDLFNNPQHPYTQGLIKSLPHGGKNQRKGQLYNIPGNVPNLLKLKPGCKFFDRCEYAVGEICLGKEPAVEKIGLGHIARCKRLKEIRKDGGLI